jgi:hypothetical protein
MRIVPYVAVSLLLGACGAFSADSDPARPAPAADGGGAGEAGSSGDGASGAPDGGADGSSLDSDSGDAGLAAINCFGTLRNAFYCDDFEGPALGTPPWSLTASSTDTSVTEIATSQNQHLTGMRSADSFVGPGGALKTATAHWTRPMGSGQALAFQLNVFIPSDAWSATDITPFAAVVGSSSRIDLVFSPNGLGSNGRLLLQVTGAQGPLDLGEVLVENWMCVEITADGMTVTASRGPDKGQSTSSSITPIGAEIGISTNLANKVFYYDNVILAPGPIGCP